jgi:hypothetical protein
MALTDEDTELPLSILCGLAISKEGSKQLHCIRLPPLIVAHACAATTRAEDVVLAFLAQYRSSSLRSLKKLLKSGNTEVVLILNLEEEDHGIDP